MIKRSFVSISFSTGRLQIVKLSSSKEKVEKYATVDLPGDLFKGHRVQNKEILAGILRNAWEKMKIRERSVGIVVPEFSAFSKLLTFPKLEFGELDEAVRWQARDFLPSKVTDMSMDWKIVKKEKDAYTVFLMAMDKEILNGYVGSVGLAGLFPLVVEPSSLSLTRISGEEAEGRLIIYKYFDETIVVIAQGLKIVGSSVVYPGGDGQIARTIMSLVQYHKEIKVDKVLVGGMGLDQNIVKEIQGTVNAPINRLNVDIKNLSQEDVQKYLIPISLQLIKPMEPSDTETINLLPQSVVDKYRVKNLQVRIWSLMTVVTFMIWSSFFAVIGTYIYLYQQTNEYKFQSGSKHDVISKTRDIREQIRKINETSSAIVKISKEYKYPVEIMNAIKTAKPWGIEIKEYKIDSDTGEVDLIGLAAIRGDLINFKQKLEENEDFSHIAIPISSFEVERDLMFNMSFLYKFK